MTAAEAIKELEFLVTSREEVIKQLYRKRWKPSEKLMTHALYRRQIEALSFAIGALCCMRQQETRTVVPGTNIPDAGTPVY